MKTGTHTYFSLFQPFISALLGMACLTPVHGQILHAEGAQPTFEVATIKLWRPPAPLPPPPMSGDAASPAPPRPAKFAPGKPGVVTSDRVNNISPIRVLIASAYDVPFGLVGSRILGGPDWLGSDQYELQAKIGETAYAAIKNMAPAEQREQVDLMEQSLLADRFKLKVHFEKREQQGLALVVAKGGSKLTPATEGEISRLSLEGNAMTAKAITLDQWIQGPFLTGRSVVNQTGLTGSYDFTLTWKVQANADSQDSVSDLPSLFTAVQEQLGLKLVPMKTSVEVIVIDHIERPSDN